MLTFILNLFRDNEQAAEARIPRERMVRALAKPVDCNTQREWAGAYCKRKNRAINCVNGRFSLD